MSAPDDDHVCQEVAGARVHASPDLTPEARDAIGQVVGAARERFTRERQGSRPQVVRHSLASVARGGPLYRPTAVRLTQDSSAGLVPWQLRLSLGDPADAKHSVSMVLTAEQVDDPYQLSDALEAMLRTLYPPRTTRLP